MGFENLSGTTRGTRYLLKIAYGSNGLCAMPVVYVCSRCGAVVYRFERAGQDYYGIPTPSELSARVGGFCPKCGKPISTRVDLSNVSVKPK